MAESKNEYQEGKNKFYWLSLKKLNFDQSELLWKVKKNQKLIWILIHTNEWTDEYYIICVDNFLI